MNIFYIDRDPVKAAKWLVDSHVVKMVLEGAQMLSTAHFVIDGAQIPGTYTPTHINHPCSIWVRQSYFNYRWLYNHTMAIAAEYTHRYGKVHKTAQTVMPLLKPAPQNIDDIYSTDPPLCMPDEYKISSDAVESYRYFYTHGKKHLHKWKNANPPHWILLNTSQKENINCQHITS